MMEKIDDGGRVYPLITPSGNTISKGITRREWLTGMALQGLLANPTVQDFPEMKRDDGIVNIIDMNILVAEKFADAMIAKSKK